MHVIRDVELHRGWVGHVLVCPGGIYVLEPRRWRGAVKLSGSRLVGGTGTAAAIRDVLEDATKVRRRLAASGVVRGVGAVIALTDTTLPDGPIALRELDVVEAAVLPAWIRGRKFRLEPLEIEQIRHALTPHDETPWRPPV